MSDLVEFLRARLDEDEQAARAATPGQWTYRDSAVFAPEYQPKGYGRGIAITRASYTGDILDHPANAEHIARHGPARVLREVEAKRRIIETCEYFLHEHEAGVDPAANATLHLLAVPYAYHPDYREEWRS